MKKVDWLLKKKKSFVSQSMGYFFCGNGFIQWYHMRHVEQEKAKGCPLVYLSSHVDK